MVPQFPSLKRPSRDARRKASVIDLSDAATQRHGLEAAGPEPGVGPVAEDVESAGEREAGDQAPTGPVGEPSGAQTDEGADSTVPGSAAQPDVPAQSEDETGGTAVLTDTAAETEADELGDARPADTVGTDAGDAAPHQPGWGHRLMWFATLSRHAAGTLHPATSIVLAWAWLLVVVLTGCLAVTAAIGLIGGGSLFDPAVFVASWRVAHLMPVASADGAVSLVPMLPGLLVVALVARASAWLWTALQRVGGPSPINGIAALGAAYVAVAALIATSPTSGAQSGPVPQGWGALLGVVLVGLGWTAARGSIRSASPRLWLLLRAVAMVMVLLLTVAFLLVMARLLFSWSQFQAMSGDLLASGVDPASRFDAAALGALQLAYLPNVVVWTAAYIVGAGFSVGIETIVSPFTVTTGTLPEIPLASLLPATPLSWPLLPPVLIAVGSMAAGAVIRSAGLARRMRTRLVVGGLIAASSAVAMTVLAAASNGGLGPGRLQVMGPAAVATGVATLLVIGLGQLGWALFPTLVADVGPLVSNARHLLLGWAAGLSMPRVRRRRRRGAAPDPGEPTGGAKPKRSARRGRSGGRRGRKARGSGQRARHT